MGRFLHVELSFWKAVTILHHEKANTRRLVLIAITERLGCETVYGNTETLGYVAVWPSLGVVQGLVMTMGMRSIGKLGALVMETFIS